MTALIKEGPPSVPDPQDPATFERSHLRWDERDRPGHVELLSLYRRLTALRRERPELTDPDMTHTLATVEHADAAPDARAFRIDRGTVAVLVNLTGAEVGFEVRPGDALLLETSGARMHDDRITLAPESAAIVGPPL